MDTSFWTVKNCVAALFLLLAVVLAGTGGFKTVKAIINASQPCVDGFVVSSDIEIHSVDMENPDTPTPIFYNTVICIQYAVDEKVYQCNDIFGGICKNNSAKAQDIIKRYPSGTIVRVRYNRENPENARIDTTSFAPGIFYLFGSLPFFALAFLSRVLIKDPPEELIQPIYVVRRPTFKSHANEDNTRDAAPEIIPPYDPRHQIMGQWNLEYQIPSVREIIASSQNGKKVENNDMRAVFVSGSTSLKITITGKDIEFKYLDSKSQGSCDISSTYRLSGNRLTLDHMDMCVLLADVQGFPPDTLKFSRKGDKLLLVSDEVKDLGNRTISFHLSLCH